MDASVIIRRIRTAIGQQTFYGEPVDTKDNVTTSSRTNFTDRDLLERVNASLSSVFPLLDESILPIISLTDPTNPISENYIILPSRIYRNGIRAKRINKEDAVAQMFSNRQADEDSPVFTLENDFLQVYPAGGEITAYAKQKPTSITWTDYQAGTEDINVPSVLTEWIVQMVTSECTATMASDEPHDNDILFTGSRWNLMAGNEEIAVLLPNSNILHSME